MKTRIVLIFIVALLLPTALLAYFGLLAVRSEKSIIEKNIKQRYETMADIVEAEIKKALAEAPEDVLANRRYMESILLAEASIFRDQMKILDKKGRAVGGAGRSFTSGEQKRQLANPILSRPIKDLPYTIAVYERHPQLLKKLEERKKGLYLYIVLISASALAILCGGAFTLWALSREWRLTELKSQFVSHLSHDLRRPLTSIRMFSEMLKDDRVPSEEKKLHYYDVITQESERLTHLANNILDFSRITRGRKEYNFKPANIKDIVSESIGRFERYMLQEPRRIIFNSNGDFPLINMDAGSISQAMINLLLNAAKYSPSESEIIVNLFKDKNDIVTEIIDKGIGIPKKEQNKVFRRFYRTSQKEISEKEGSGLGLTLVKYTAEAHRGRVKLESEEGKGSKFSLILPI